MKSFMNKLVIQSLGLSLLLAASAVYANQSTIFSGSKNIHVTTVKTDSATILEPTAYFYGGKGGAYQCSNQKLLGKMTLNLMKNDPVHIYIGGFNKKEAPYTCGNLVVKGKNSAYTVSDTFKIIYNKQGQGVSSAPKQRTIVYNENK